MRSADSRSWTVTMVLGHANVPGEDHDLISLENVIRVDCSAELDYSAHRNVLRLSHDDGGIGGENRNDRRRPFRRQEVDSVALSFKHGAFQLIALDTLETHHG